MAQQTKLDRFRNYCEYSSITLERLKAKQTNYDFVKEHILYSLCRNRKLTIHIIRWLLSEYPQAISVNDGCNWSPLEDFFVSNVFSIEQFTIIIDHIIGINFNLYNKYSANQIILHSIFASESFDGPMLNYLYQRDPHLNITFENDLEVSPLFNLILYSRKLYEMIQVIKSNEPVHSKTQIRTRYTDTYSYTELKTAINMYSRKFDQSTICALIESCGELFSLIRPKYLTQDICNQFYSSKYFCWSPDQDSLIKLIPEQFQTNLRDVNSHGQKTKPALRVQLEPE
jgi:hypothetical protein